MSVTEARLWWYVQADAARREESERRERLMAEYLAKGYSDEAAYELAMGQLDPYWGDVPF